MGDRIPPVPLDNEDTSQRPLAAHPGIFALFQWPALAGILVLPWEGWGFPLKTFLVFWVAGLQVLAFRRLGWDNLPLGFSVLGNNVFFAAAWQAYPHWTYLPWAWLLGASFFSSLALVRLIRRDRESWREGF